VLSVRICCALENAALTNERSDQQKRADRSGVAWLNVDDVGVRFHVANLRLAYTPTTLLQQGFATGDMGFKGLVCTAVILRRSYLLRVKSRHRHRF